MPLSSSIVGIACESVHSTPDARWTMAFAAALNDTLPCYLDTRRAGGVIAHPLFPVCIEWPAFLKIAGALRDPAFPLEEATRGVHATHDLIIHRPIRAGDRLSTRAIVASIERRRPGAYMVARIETFDSSGLPVCTTWYGSLYRGVGVTGEDRPVAGVPARPSPSFEASSPNWETAVPISGGLAHIYTECARIWNPIHTDAAVAAQAGLPAIILHGTATLALAVSQIVAREADGHPERVTRVAGRFSSMVRLPSVISVRMLGRRDGDRDSIWFSVVNADGEEAIRDGLVEMRSSRPHGKTHSATV